MKKKPYYTDAFYSNPRLALDVLNKLNSTKFVKELDMYSSGTFLIFEVTRNEETEKIVSSVISDIDGYLIANQGNFSYNGTNLDFSALHEEHMENNASTHEIKWNAEEREFCFANELWED